ncbi:UDP-N-acetylmuramoylalanine--D-glutamate ligase [Cyanobium sp.]|nr:UDP-N-acetylmuramoylalanine--D-glutamate ligase [Cyanobium sp.]
MLRALGEPVCLAESRSGDALAEQAAALEAEGIPVKLGLPLDADRFDALTPPPATVVVSPGIRFDHPALEALRARGVAVQGELVGAWRAGRAVPWIGITGTNGKTTVTHLVHHLLVAGGLDAPLCGNVGTSAADVVRQRIVAGPAASGVSPSGLSALGASLSGGSFAENLAFPDWLVVELSSYQIEAAPELAPAIGIWTTLTPDHLERHGTLEAYREIKRQLLEQSGLRILNADDADLRSRAASWDQACWITAGPRQAALDAGIDPHLWIEAGEVWNADGPLFPAAALAMPGDHNRQNLLLAAAVALAAGLTPAVIEAGCRSFPGVPHRLERIRLHQGITWFNDSKATNYDAAEVALRALDGPLVVLAGGQSKQGDAAGWIAQLHRQAAAVILYGAARQEFTGLLAAGGYSGRVESVEGLDQAVPLARQLAAEGACPAVLLSPACASFDQYSDFEARGHHFRRLVLAL